MQKQLLFLAAFLFLSTTFFAQNLEYRNVISANLGFSTVGTVIDLLDGNNLAEFDGNTDDIDIIDGFFTGRSAPALQASYDYGINKWFSVGGGISFQNLEFNIRDLTYFDNETSSTTNLSSLNLETSRINITARILFHYGNAKKVDMYSGLRLGVTNWLTTIQASDPSVESDLEQDIPFFGIVPTGQLIPFAFRAYFNENLGFNFETGLGAPHFLAIGLNYRL
ncbi:MAG: hypothetical protein AAGI23_18325 [Bacteroidota bacterium]